MLHRTKANWLLKVRCIKSLFCLPRGPCLNQILGTQVTTDFISLARTDGDGTILKIVLQNYLYFLPVRTMFKDGFCYYGSNASVNRA